MDAVESAARASQTNDPSRPSFFELIAQDQLRDLLHPAVRYTLSVLAQRNPRYLLRIFNRFDEVWALVMLLVERHYLKTWGSSFAENFYMLKRRRRPGLTSSRLPMSRHSEQLTSWQINASLLFLVGVPYCQSKARQWWESNGGGADPDLFGDDEHDEGGDGQQRFTGIEADNRRMSIAQLKQKAVKAFPYLSSSWHLWILWYNVRYLFAKSPFWRPWLSWLNLEIRRVAPGDYPDTIPLLPPDLPSPLTRPREFLVRLVRSTPYIAFESLKYLLPASIFFFKFLEWWYSGENPRRRRGGEGEDSGSQEPSFGAPKVLMPSKNGVLYQAATRNNETEIAIEMQGRSKGAPSLLHNSCPLCGTAPMNNPAVLPTGYAFCYVCANGYIEEHGKCPITQAVIRDGSEGIRRVLG